MFWKCKKAKKWKKFKWAQERFTEARPVEGTAPTDQARFTMVAAHLI